MTTLYQQLADNDSAVVLTDTDGVIVHMVSSPEFAAEVGPLGLRAGGMWSEIEAGTNGMGTCLAAASPVSVRREDHFYTQFTQLTCSAVPVFDPAGEIVAALDVSSRSSLMQQHLLVLLGMTARMIENRLIDKRFRSAHPLHFHSRPEFVYTLHEGRLAVGDDGRILAANRSALFQLGLQSIEEIHGPNAPEKLLYNLFERKTSSVKQRVRGNSIEERARSLAAIRDEEGHMAQFLNSPIEGGPHILECHSPIMNLVEKYEIIGRLEQQMFEEVLGISVRREETRTSGLYEAAFYFAL